jgi:orotate phosphoribosyltransferase
MTNLFQTGDFTLASGRKSSWKIECDALTPADWAGLAAMAAQVLPPFREVFGVPRGGVPFGLALDHYVDPKAKLILIAEDVCTTGGSITRYRDSAINAWGGGPEHFIGVCAFARGPCPPWVTPLLVLNSRLHLPEAEGLS